MGSVCFQLWGHCLGRRQEAGGRRQGAGGRQHCGPIAVCSFLQDTGQEAAGVSLADSLQPT